MNAEPTSILQDSAGATLPAIERNERNRTRPSCSNRLPILFLIIGSILALAYAIVVPPFQVPDEDRHLWRAYGVSDFHLVPPARTQIPASLVRLHDRFPPRLEGIPGKRVVHAAELAYWLSEPLEVNVTMGVENPNGNLYSFVPHVATSLMLRVGRYAGWSPLLLLYAGRLANATVYLWLVYMALRILPEFRLLLLTIALSPMSLHEAASFSADSLTLALAALFTAYVLKLAFDESVATVRSRDVLALGILLVLLALCKFNIWTAMLVALIPARKFGSRRRAALFFAGCALAAIIAALSWHSINAAAISAFRAAYAADGKSITANAAFLSDQPARVFEFMLFTDSQLFWIWWQEFIGTFGWTFIRLSPMHVFIYTAGIVLAASTRSARIAIARWQKVLAVSFVVLTFVSLHLLMWVFETQARSLGDALHSWVIIAGIQGRYFIPVAMPALILLKRRLELNGLLVTGTLVSVVGINIVALLTISLVYS